MNNNTILSLYGNIGYYNTVGNKMKMVCTSHTIFTIL